MVIFHSYVNVYQRVYIYIFIDIYRYILVKNGDRMVI